jgi:hypothetical protein
MNEDIGIVIRHDRDMGASVARGCRSLHRPLCFSSIRDILAAAQLARFCVTGALFLPNDSANTAIGIGIVGCAILLVYWLAFLFAKRTVVRQQQNKTVDYKVMRQKNDAAQQQKSEQRTQKTQILGMSFGNFYQERSESHLKFWLAIFFFAAVIYVAVFTTATSMALLRDLGRHDVCSQSCRSFLFC